MTKNLRRDASVNSVHGIAEIGVCVCLDRGRRSGRYSSVETGSVGEAAVTDSPSNPVRGTVRVERGDTLLRSETGTGVVAEIRHA